MCVCVCELFSIFHERQLFYHIIIHRESHAMDVPIPTTHVPEKHVRNSIDRSLNGSYMHICVYIYRVSLPIKAQRYVWYFESKPRSREELGPWGKQLIIEEFAVPFQSLP